MILDTSAIVAILLNEAAAERLISAVETSTTVAVGAPTLVETSVVLGARIGFPRQSFILNRWLQAAGVSIIPFTDVHWNEAARAYETFGRGRHPAALNFGDCLSYAVASVAGLPLLCLGDEFPKTDLSLVVREES